MGGGGRGNSERETEPSAYIAISLVSWFQVLSVSGWVPSAGAGRVRMVALISRPARRASS